MDWIALHPKGTSYVLSTLGAARGIVSEITSQECDVGNGKNK